MPRRAREVCYDGKPAADYQVRSLRRRIGYVAQSPVLLSGTVMDNLRYGDRDASEADVRRAARVAEIHADLMRLPAGYASEIGERGANLSDGQKQRLSIARALVKDPDILAQAIESVLGQTHRDLELVVIDDGSTDGSLGIMERYARADRRVRVFTQENQGGDGNGEPGA